MNQTSITDYFSFSSSGLVPKIGAKSPRFHEVIERENLYPIVHDDIMKLYFAMREVQWTENNIIVHLSSDRVSFLTLTKSEERLFRMTLGFFTVIDSLINKVIGNSYLSYFEDPEYSLAYGIQNYMEGIHQICYNEFVKIYYNGDINIFLAYKNNEAIKRKISWTKKWLANDDIRIRIFIQGLIEGVDIVNVFGIIFWFKTVGKMAGFLAVNEYIEVDEYFHYLLACLVYNKMPTKLPWNIIQQIISEYMEINDMFYSFMEEEIFVGLNFSMIIKNTKFYLNKYVTEIGYEPIYIDGVKLPYLDNRDIGRRTTSFFTKPSTDYKEIEFSKEDLELEF